MSLLDDWNAAAEGAAAPARRPPGQPQRHQQQQQQQQQERQRGDDAAKPTNPFRDVATPPTATAAAAAAAAASSSNPFQEERKLVTASSSVSMASTLSSLLGDDALDSEDEEDAVDTSPSFEVTPFATGQGLPGSGAVKILAAGGGVAIVVAATARGGEEVWLWELVSGGKKLPIAVSSLEAGRNPVRFAAVCPLGCHALLSLGNGDNYYLNIKGASASAVSLRAKGPIQRLKDVVVASVAWDTENRSQETTGEVLLGTTKGGIWQVCIEAARLKDRKTIKRVYQLGNSITVCGLHAVRMSASGDKWFVMAATARPTRFYEFAGGPTLEAMFERYLAPENQSFRELPGDVAVACLHCYTPAGPSDSNARPESFMLLSEAGLYIGRLQFDGDGGDGDKIASRHNMVYFPGKTKASGEELQGPPISALETEFHFVLLYPGWLIVLSKLSEAVVHEQRLDVARAGPTLGLSWDPTRRDIWLVSERQVACLAVRNEDGNVWRLFLEQARNGDPSMFEVALEKCATDSQRDKVLTVRADHHFARGEYELAARYNAGTNRSFEEVALMFIDKSRREALRTYLTLKLDALPASGKTQRTIIAVWIVELFLERAPLVAGSKEEDDEEEDAVGRELQSFLFTHRELLRPAKDTIYKLIASHGRDADYIAYAMVNGDFERVVVLHMQRGLHAQAVATLAEQSRRWSQRGQDPPEAFVELYYKYSPELLERCPEASVDAWIDAPFLEPGKLIPALIRYSRARKDAGATGEDHAIRYLEHAVNEQANQDEAIHNLLVALYAGASQDDDGPLREFLAAPSGCFDLKYALRVCNENGQQRACVEIYSAMGLFAEAVELALNIDQDLARINADMVADRATRRKLWLMIAKREIADAAADADGGQTAVDRALAILKESDALMIEDVLPFLPDVAAIGDLKDEICHSLEQYGEEIDVLKGEMDEFTSTAETIRAEIAQQDDAFMLVDSSHMCDLCGKPVIGADFYVFPCTHAFHSACLLDEVSRHLGAEQAERVEALRALLDRTGSLASALGPDTASNPFVDDDYDGAPEAASQGDAPMCKAERDKLAQLNDFVAAACPFCGDLMIQSIAEPFVTEEERAEAAEWAV